MVVRLFKLVRWAVDEYGVRGTLSLVPNYVFHRSAYYTLETIIGFDRKHGTDTTGMVDAMHFGVEAGEAKGAHVYMACAPWVVERGVRALPRPPSELTFVDYGSGKGRALILAAEHGFKKVVGVELSPRLSEIAQRNIDIFRERHPEAPEIEVVCNDARELGVPPGDCLLFFFNPFELRIMRDVLAGIRQSLEDHPRKIFLLFQNEEPARKSLDEAQDWLHLVERHPIGPMMGSWAIYEAKLTPSES